MYHFSKNVQRLHFLLPLGGFNIRVNNSVKRLRRHVAFAPRANSRRRGCKKRRRNVCEGRSLQGIAPILPFVPEDFGVTSCNTRPRPGDRDPKGPAPPSAPTTQIPPIGTRPLNAEAKVFYPQSSLSPTSSAAPLSSQSSSPIPSLTSTTVSPLLSTPGKVLNVSNQDLRYRSMSSLAGTPPPSSPPGYGKGFGRIWSDDERMVHLDRLANRMV